MSDTDTGLLSPNEPVYIPQANTVHGDNHGLLTSQVNGGAHFYGSAKAEPETVITRLASPEEVRDAGEQFVEPGGFFPALRTLQSDQVVVLCGKGTGRTHAARRMLTHESGHTSFAYLNRARSLDRLRADDLAAGGGYLLDLTGTNDRPMTGWAFEQGLHAVRAAGCRLVVVLDHREQSPAAAANQTFTLTAPSPVEVAQSALRRRHDVTEALLHLVKNDLAPALEGASPDKAMFAARLAVEVHENRLALAKALTELRAESVDSVARWFEQLDIRGHAYSFTVALLENQPYEHVLARGWELDERIRTAALPVDKNLRPRGLLELPKTALLRDIAATTELRDHPRITGQSEETIRFERQDWAPAVFTHVWQQYPAAREILRDWMCDDTSEEAQDAVVRAICTIVTTVPAREPVALVEHLASQPDLPRRSVAVAALVRLAEDDRMRGPVEQAMRAWVEEGKAYRMWTVARVYSVPSPHRPPHVVLEVFTAIGQSSKITPQNAVVAGVLPMLLDVQTRAAALATVVSWTSWRYRETGLRRVSLGLGLWVIGFYEQSRTLSATLTDDYPDEVTKLLRHVLDDGKFGPHLLRRMADLARFARWDADDAAELLRLVRLITPRLDWRWRWRPTVRKLCLRHPTMRPTIHRIFRTARKVQPS
ncbi:hypothetical protein [Nocardia sp. NRRL S-836]|uniref:hypothetical protein n=1 Tax=Nocardia sp. NRRL S-836 TaxID=1519492 RepID=UPI0006B027F2|nr:hypothetical protein [Nocardia sp. NRRL S-836]KOV89694.1 hypothetical protein ADL03_02395 [Nocardia sp. NRRL S-836]